MRIQRTMKIAAACAALAACAAVVAANIPIKGTPCTGKWADCDAPRSALEKPGWKLTFSDDFVDRLRKLVARTLSVLALDRPGK